MLVDAARGSAMDDNRVAIVQAGDRTVATITVLYLRIGNHYRQQRQPTQTRRRASASLGDAAHLQHGVLRRVLHHPFPLLGRLCLLC